MTELKDTNPKDAIGIKKVAWSCLCWNVLGKLALALLEGALKYGRHNYRVAGVRASVYFDACMRHLTRWWEGEDIDPESGLPHLVKAMACLHVAQDAIDNGKMTDDRPPAIKAGWTDELNAKAGALIEQYKDTAKPAYTQAGVTSEFK